MNHRLTVGLVAGLLLFAGCSSGTGVEPTSTVAVPTTGAPPSTTTSIPADTATTSAPPTTVTTQPQLELAFSELPFIPQGLGHYEGWLIIDGEPISTGKFNANTTGENFSDLSGGGIGPFVLDFDPAGATAFVLTIEPNDDPDPAPSETHVLAGDLIGGAADLTVSHPAALANDFADAGGEFVLATPTDGDRTNNEFSGVWFLKFPGPVPGLDLPTLPAGWTYEGWVVIDGIPVTTGTFLGVDESDAAAPYSGTVRTPNFPGEDFLQNAPDGLTFPTDLSGTTVVISVEPVPDFSPLPFDLKPLSGPIPEDAELEPVAYPVSRDAFVAPAGTATLS